MFIHMSISIRSMYVCVFACVYVCVCACVCACVCVHVCVCICVEGRGSHFLIQACLMVRGGKLGITSIR